MLLDAVGSPPFWAVAPELRHEQILHFAKNLSIVGAFVLLLAIAPPTGRAKS